MLPPLPKPADKERQFGDRLGNVMTRALRNSRRRWKADDHGRRIGGLSEPIPQASFQIYPSDTVFTIGSCFARHAEEHLRRLGLHVPTLGFSVPEHEQQGQRPNSILNKYSVPAMATELRLALDPGGLDPALLLAQPVPGEWVDLQLASPKHVSRARALERRMEVTGLFTAAFDADVVVLTLGQIECWYDTVAGVHVNQFPPGALSGAEPGRFYFERLGIEENLAWLRWVVEALLANGRQKRILLTVSPVPMAATFHGGDVLQQHVYGKSLLRVVAETVLTEHVEVDYFPAFEAAMLSDRDLVWEEDGVHVQDGFVASIVERLVAAYVTEPVERAAPDLSRSASPGDLVLPSS